MKINKLKKSEETGVVIKIMQNMTIFEPVVLMGLCASNIKLNEIPV